MEEEQKHQINGQLNIEINDNLQQLRDMIEQNNHNHVTQLELHINTNSGHVLQELKQLFQNPYEVLDITVTTQDDFTQHELLSELCSHFDDIKILKIHSSFESVHWLKMIMQRCTKIQILHIHNKSMSFDNLSNLGAMIASLQQLDELHLNFKKSRISDLASFQDAFINQSVSIFSLDISYTQVKSLKPLLNGLMYQYRIKHVVLDIREIPIHDDETIQQCLQTLSALEKVKILHSNNSMKVNILGFSYQEKVFPNHRILSMQRQIKIQTISAVLNQSSEDITISSEKSSQYISQPLLQSPRPKKQSIQEEKMSLIDWLLVAFWMCVTYGMIVLVWYVGWIGVKEDFRVSMYSFIGAFVFALLTTAILWGWGLGKRQRLIEDFIKQKIAERMKEIDESIRGTN